MAFMGLDPEKARTLSSAMRQTGMAADDLSSEVTAALTLSQLDSELPGQLVFTSDELEQLGLIVEARVDIAEGFTIDPATLAADVGITVEQAEAAIAAFAEPEANPKQLTPFIDALVANKQAAEVLRSSFVNTPPLGENPEFDQALLRLGTWLPLAIESGEMPTLTDQQVLDLTLLAGAAELPKNLWVPNAEHIDGLYGIPGIAVNEDGTGFVTIQDGAVTAAAATPELIAALGTALFNGVVKVHEFDSRLRSAAGLPSAEDMLLQYQIEADRFDPFDARFAVLDEWLPAYTIGELPEGGLPETAADKQLLLDFARHFGYAANPQIQTAADFAALAPNSQKAVFDNVLRYFRQARWVQKSLIPGDFEAIASPIIVWTEPGIDTALLAGRRQGVITDETERIANLVAENVIVNPDGSAEPIELTQEQQQALVAAVIAQNGEPFVMDDPGIQRQIVAAINLVGQQTTLDDQRSVFAKAIEAFRSLNMVGSPAVTWSQLKEVVGAQVTDELGHTRLTGRSAEATNKRPQFIALINHWGIPGGDTIKLKKRKFSFTFDESGKLTQVRNKKLSKWKRFKNSVKAFGKALWSEWTDNPWKYLFMGHAGLLPGANQVAEGVEDGDFDDIAEGSVQMTKFAASVAATVFPATSAAGIAAMAVLVADTVYQASQGNWLGALGSAFSVAGGAAGYIGDVAAVGSAANIVSNAAAVGEGVVKAIDVGDDFVAAIKDGDIFSALGSGFAIAGSAAKIIGSGAELANGVGLNMSGGPPINPELLNQVVGSNMTLVDPASLVEDLTHSVVSSDTIGLITQIGDTAGELQNITGGIESTVEAIKDENIVGAITSGFETLGKGADLIGVSGETIGLSGDGIESVFSPETQELIRAGKVTIADLAPAVKSGIGIADAVGDGDVAQALANAFQLAGNAADVTVNDQGIVAGLADLDPKTVKILTEFGATTADQLSGLTNVGGSLADGDILGALENAVATGRIGLDESGRRLAGQLDVADKALGLGRYIEGVADGRHGIDLQSVVLGVGGLGRAIVDVPDAPVQNEPNILGSDANGNVLIDDNQDGVADRAIRMAAGGGSPQAGTRGPTITDRTRYAQKIDGQLRKAERALQEIDSTYGPLPEGTMAERDRLVQRIENLKIAEQERQLIDDADAERLTSFYAEVGDEYLDLDMQGRAEYLHFQLDEAIVQASEADQGAVMDRLLARQELLENIVQTPGSSISEIDAIGAGFDVIDGERDSTDQYFLAEGRSAVLGIEDRKLIMDHPEIADHVEQIGREVMFPHPGRDIVREGRLVPDTWKARREGSWDLKERFETYSHIGSTDVYWRLSDDNKTIRYTVEGDGIRDIFDVPVLGADDGEGPSNEIPAADPFSFRRFEFDRPVPTSTGARSLGSASVGGLSPDQQAAIVRLAAQEETAASIDAAVLGPLQGSGITAPPTLTPDQQAAIVRLAAQEETAASIDAAVLGPLQGSGDQILPTPPRPDNVSTAGSVTADIRVDGLDGRTVPGSDRALPSTGSARIPGYQGAREDGILRVGDDMNALDAIAHESHVMSGGQLSGDAGGEVELTETGEPWTENFPLSEELGELADGARESHWHAIEEMGPSTQAGATIGPVSIHGGTTEQKTLGSQLRTFPTTDPDNPKIVAQNADIDVDYATGGFGLDSGMVDVGGSGGIIPEGVQRFDRVAAPASQIAETGKLPDADPVTLEPNNEVWNFEIGVAETGVILGGEVGVGLGKKDLGPVDLKAKAEGSLEFDRTRYDGVGRYANRIDDETTVVQHTDLDLHDQEVATKGDVQAGISAEAGFDPSNSRSDQQGINVKAGLGVRAKGEAIRQNFFGDFEGLAATHDAGSDSIQRHYEDGIIDVEMGETYAEVEGEFSIETKMFEAGGGGKATVDLGGIGDDSSLATGDIGYTAEEQTGVLIDRTETFDSTEIHRTAAEDRTIDMATGPNLDDHIAWQVDKTTALNDNQYSIHREEGRLPGDPVLTTPDGLGITNNVISTNSGSIEGSDDYLKDLAQDALAHNPDLDNDFLKDVAGGADPAIAASDHNPSHIFTPITDDPVTEGAEALVAEKERQELVQGLPDEF